MGFARGPKLHPSGLVLAIDAASNRSYPGTGTTWSDLSGNGYDSTLINSPSYTTTNKGEIDFDGSNDYGSFSSAAHDAISALSAGTIETWIKLDSVTNRRTIFGTGHSSNTSRWVLFRHHSSNGVQLSVNNEGSDQGGYTGTVLSTGTWYHLAVTYDGSSNAIYVNGVSQSMTVASGGAGFFSDVSTNTLQVGSLDRGTLGNTYDPFNGKIPCVRVFNIPLTAQQVLNNYNAQKNRFE